MSTPAGGLVGDAHINVNANTDPANRALRDFSRSADRRLRDVRGRFVSESALINGAFNRAAGGGSAFSGALEQLKASAISLAPALIPIAVQAAPIAAGVGAAAVAIGVFAAAAAGQVTALTEASEAEKKYKDAVNEHGASSKEASQASAAYARQLAQMPPATREAAVGLSGLKDQYQTWSDSLAGSTMPVATKAFATFGAIFPKLTPLVQGTGAQLNRFMTIAAGGVASPGFDKFMQSFSTFAVGALQKANDALVRFTMNLDTGKVSGGVSEFMEYARANGPLVRDTLSKVAQALGNILKAAAAAGPGMLTVVNALAGLVAAVPPGVITVMLQLALALKAVRLAAVAMAATQTALTGFAASVGVMRLAAAGATGVLPRLSAAFGTLSASARFGVAAAAVGAMVLAVRALSDNKAPVAVDELSTSLNTLASTGQVTGALKANFDEMSASIAMMSKGASDNKLLQLTSDFGTWVGIASGPSVSDATKNLDAWDKVMANNVAAGNPKIAAAQFEILRKAWAVGGNDMSRLKTFTNDYENALAAQKFEQQLAVQAMGIFGLQAQDTSAKLDTQRAAADGLRAAITALNDVNRSAYDAQIGFESSLDSLTASFKEHGATLNLDTEAGRANGQAMSAAARAQDELIASGLAAGESLGSMTKRSSELRTEMMRLAVDAFDGNKKKATEYVNTLLGVPGSIATEVRLEKAAAITGLKDVRTAVAATPNAKKITVETLNGAAIKALEAVGLKTRQLPDGRTEVTTGGNARSVIDAIARAMSNLNGKTATTYVRTVKLGGTSMYANKLVPAGATGGLYTGTAFKHRGYAGGGLVNGPGTEKSDDVYAPWLSKNEFVVNAKQTAKHLPLLRAVNEDRLDMGGLAAGTASAGGDAALGLAQGLTGRMGSVTEAAQAMAAAVVAAVRTELQISSPSKKLAKLGKDTGTGFLKGLTGTQAQISSTAKSMAASITNAFKGTASRVDDRLVSMLSAGNKRLQALANERDAISRTIAAAKAFAASTSEKARGSFSLASLAGETTSESVIEKQLRRGAKAINDFAKNIRILKAKGLSEGLLRQLLELGPEQGAGLAQTIAAQSEGYIKRINKLQGSVTTASNALGQLGADTLYDAGKQAGKGLLTGLKAQQKEIEALMLSIAKGMQKAIRKALGIKSPSTVMAEVGRLSSLGLAVGLRDRLPQVRQAVGALADSVAGGGGGLAVAGPGMLPVGVSRTAAGRTATAVPATVNNNYYVTVSNRGVISSQRDMETWLIKSLETLRRTKRLPGQES